MRKKIALAFLGICVSLRIPASALLISTRFLFSTRLNSTCLWMYVYRHSHTSNKSSMKLTLNQISTHPPTSYEEGRIFVTHFINLTQDLSILIWLVHCAPICRKACRMNVS